MLNPFCHCYSPTECGHVNLTGFTAMHSFTFRNRVKRKFSMVMANPTPPPWLWEALLQKNLFGSTVIFLSSMSSAWLCPLVNGCSWDSHETVVLHQVFITKNCSLFNFSLKGPLDWLSSFKNLDKLESRGHCLLPYSNFPKSLYYNYHCAHKLKNKCIPPSWHSWAQRLPFQKSLKLLVLSRYWQISKE